MLQFTQPGKRRGLFGSPAPVSTPGYGDGMAVNEAAPMGGAMPKKSGGLFGGDSALWKVLGAFGDAFGEGEPIYTQSILAKQRRADEEAQYNRQREDKFTDWTRQQEWELAHPKPVNNDTVNDYQFLLEKLGPEQAELYLKNRADPPQYRQGPDGQFYRVAPSAATPKVIGPQLSGDWELEGGGVSNGPGGFPRR